MNATALSQDARFKSVLALERPHASLWTYYIIVALLTGPGLIVLLPYLFFRYHTLRYRFDAEGVHMRVGLLFRQETNLTYARIQDIHLRSGLLQRWLGLANVEIQTASGSAKPELVVEGFKEYETIRDFLYLRMRGGRGGHSPAPAAALDPSSATSGVGLAVVSGSNNETVESLLLSIRDELRATRAALERKGGDTATTKRSPDV